MCGHACPYLTHNDSVSLCRLHDSSSFRSIQNINNDAFDVKLSTDHFQLQSNSAIIARYIKWAASHRVPLPQIHADAIVKADTSCIDTSMRRSICVNAIRWAKEKQTIMSNNKRRCCRRSRRYDKQRICTFYQEHNVKVVKRASHLTEAAQTSATYNFCEALAIRLPARLLLQ